jgi:hypothetical protein
MIPLRLQLPLLVSLALLLGTPVQAADEVNVAIGATHAGPGLAVRGYDVVAYFTTGKPEIGLEKFALSHNGGTYRFASQANLDAFKADPAKYEPAFGGFCAYGVALGKKFDGDPHFWKIVNGKLYLNLDGDIQAKWGEDIPGNIAKADGNWTSIRTIAVDKL